MKAKIKELASDNVLLSAYLLLQEAKQLKANLAMELQAARDDRTAQHKEFCKFMSELWGTLRNIQADFKVEAQLLNLIGSQEAGDQRWQRNEGGHNSSRCRTLDALSKKTH